MATDQKDIERELGNALADRMGLYPPTTLREYEKEEDGNHVVVTMHTV
jgi:hypothetical protein